MVSSMLLSLYPGEEASSSPLDMRVGRPPIRSGLYGEEKNIFTRRESNPDTSVVQPVATQSLY
jgi:hypothetical protein